MRTTTLLGVGLVALITSVPAVASSHRVCSGGRFLASAPLIIDGRVVLDAVEIADRQVAIADVCPPVHARMRPSRRGTIVKAAWGSCAGLAGRVRLRARIDRRCRNLAGVLRAPDAEFAWSFRAARVPTCGNGIREGDEACDDGNTEDGDCCSAACEREEGSECAGQRCAASDECTAGAYCEKDGACEGEGTCRQRPEDCVGVLDPVCGCDGRTYVNACEAAAAGVSVRARGGCDRRCGTIAGLPCAEGEFCEFPPGTCGVVDNGGRCVDIQAGCPDVFRPVCGCDGHTYGNDCERRAAGAQKAHDGPCPCTPPPCAFGLRPFDRDGDGCPDACLAPCEEPCDCYRNPDLRFPRPCPLECATCDNYWVCEQGVCQDRCGPVPPGQGQCQAPPACKQNGDCDETQYCAKPPGQCDAEGTCQPRCLSLRPEPLDPVCGCDGKTYANDCEAAAAGASIAHRGPCGAECGTIAGLPCPEGEFCEFPPGTCAIVDNGGTCQPIPVSCPPERVRPVCGCDGKTYSTDCERRAVQAQKAHDGPCECAPILCPPGTLPHDSDGDGCADTCLAPCEEPCDCYRNPDLHFPRPCPLDCATCDNYWVCEQGFCEDRCGPVPPGQDQCQVTAAASSPARTPR